jgi:GT2 family glycosyltransferase
MSNPLVSIVICCHNRREYLQATLESVLAQRYRPVEIVVMDDGSTDGTPELMEGYGTAVRYHRQERQGIAVARTAASRLAQGELIAYQDDDDLMPAERITHLYAALQAYPDAAFATGDYALIDPQGRLTGARWLPGGLDERADPVLIEDGYAAILWPRVPAVPHTTLFRRELGERVGWFDPAFRYACSDADFLARLARGAPIVYLREVVSHYRRGHSAIWSDEVLASHSRLQLWTKHLELMGGDHPVLQRRLRTRMRAALNLIARHARQGRTLEDPSLQAQTERALATLGLKDRLLHGWYTSVRLPVRGLLRGGDRALSKGKRVN